MKPKLFHVLLILITLLVLAGFVYAIYDAIKSKSDSSIATSPDTPEERSAPSTPSATGLRGTANVNFAAYENGARILDPDEFGSGRASLRAPELWDKPYGRDYALTQIICNSNNLQHANSVQRNAETLNKRQGGGEAGFKSPDYESRHMWYRFMLKFNQVEVFNTIYFYKSDLSDAQTQAVNVRYWTGGGEPSPDLQHSNYLRVNVLNRAFRQCGGTSLETPQPKDASEFYDGQQPEEDVYLGPCVDATEFDGQLSIQPVKAQYLLISVKCHHWCNTELFLWNLKVFWESQN